MGNCGSYLCRTPTEEKGKEETPSEVVCDPTDKTPFEDGKELRKNTRRGDGPNQPETVPKLKGYETNMMGSAVGSVRADSVDYNYLSNLGDAMKEMTKPLELTNQKVDRFQIGQ